MTVPDSGLTEQQAADATTTRDNRWQQDAVIQQLLAMWLMFRRSPAQMLSICYFGAGLMGLMFNATLLLAFDFNVLPYLELTDLLLATVHYPQMVGWLLLMLGFALGLVTLAIRLSYRNGKQPKRPTIPVWSWLLPVVLTYLVLAAISPGRSMVRQLQQGQGEWYRVQLAEPLHRSSGASLQFLPKAQLVTRTAAYLFVLYDGELKILPHANVSALEPLAKPTKTASAPALLPVPG